MILSRTQLSNMQRMTPASILNEPTGHQKLVRFNDALVIGVARIRVMLHARPKDVRVGIRQSQPFHHHVILIPKLIVYVPQLINQGHIFVTMPASFLLLVRWDSFRD